MEAACFRITAVYDAANERCLESHCQKRAAEQPPEWFTDEWKSRVPKEMYEGIGHDAGLRRGTSWLRSGSSLRSGSDLPVDPA